MKTPSSLLLAVLFAAMPAAAERVAPQRCDTPFLDKVAKEFKGVGSVEDPRIKKADRVVAGEMVTRGVLELGDTQVCDAGTWRQLAEGKTPVWRNAKAEAYWNGGNAKQGASLLLVADDFYRAVDPKAAEVLAAADEVIAAAAAIGIVVTVDSPKEHLDFLKANSGGALALATPKAVSFTIPDDKKGGTVIPDAVDKTWRAILDEKGEEDAGGKSVLRFRIGVLALGAEIAKQGKSNEAVKRRTGDEANSGGVAGVNDFIPGLDGYSAPKADQQNAMDKGTYTRALKALIGDGTAALDDAKPRAGAVLDRVDLGLRNLIALRADQIEKIVAAARSRLNKKTITAIAVAARAGAVAKTAKNPLGEAAMKALGDTPEYAKLDDLYTRISAQGKSPANDAALREIEEQRNEMRAAALSATIAEDKTTGRKSVVFTQGNRTSVLGSFVPPVEGKEGDRDRASVGDVIAGLIVDRAKGSARYQGLVAAIGGGDAAPAITPEERPAANQVPPAVAPVKKDGAGCEKPKDLISNDHEKYAARQRAAAAEKITDNQRKIDQLKRASDAKLGAAEADCKRDRAAAAATRDTDFASPELNASNRKDAVQAADSRCVAAKKKITDDLEADLAKIKPEAATAERDKINAEANKVLSASFRKSIEVSVATLRSEYLTAGSSRQKKLIRDAELSGTSTSLVGFIKLWFNKNWPPEPETAESQKASVTACATALGLDDKSDSPSYRNPENPDKVAEYCKVHEDLTKFVVDWKGKVN